MIFRIGLLWLPLVLGKLLCHHFAFAFPVGRKDSVTPSRDHPGRIKFHPRCVHQERGIPLRVSSGFGSGGLSGNFISQLAVFAIQVCLKDYTDVSCDVSSLPQDLFRGKIGPVTVKGKGWRSSRGLTCKAIEASVDSCQLDIARVLSDQILVLTSPAEGKAMIALTAQDFGNFITHPRIERAKLQVSSSAGLSSSTIEFSRENVLVDPTTGTVTFHATCAGVSCVCSLKRPSAQQTEGRDDKGPRAKALVEVRTLQGHKDDQSTEMARRLSRVLTDFFNNIVFELYDGLFLSFRDMMVTDKGKSPSVLLALNIRVEKFPSPAVLPNSF